MIRAFALALGLLVAAGASAVAGSTASVDQTGSYSYTRVVQRNGTTFTNTRALTERSFDRVSAKVEIRASEIGKRIVRPVTRLISRCAAGVGPNSATVLQSGLGNEAFTSQSGSNDRVTVRQDGTSNLVYAVQRGSDQQADATQLGDHNIVLIVQRCR